MGNLAKHRIKRLKSLGEESTFILTDHFRASTSSLGTLASPKSFQQVVAILAQLLSSPCTRSTGVSLLLALHFPSECCDQSTSLSRFACVSQCVYTFMCICGIYTSMFACACDGQRLASAFFLLPSFCLVSQGLLLGLGLTH